jgi:hypothetical protein
VSEIPREGNSPGLLHIPVTTPNALTSCRARGRAASRPPRSRSRGCCELEVLLRGPLAGGFVGGGGRGQGPRARCTGAPGTNELPTRGLTASLLSWPGRSQPQRRKLAANSQQLRRRRPHAAQCKSASTRARQHQNSSSTSTCAASGSVSAVGGRLIDRCIQTKCFCLKATSSSYLERLATSY